MHHYNHGHYMTEPERQEFWKCFKRYVAIYAVALAAITLIMWVTK